MDLFQLRINKHAQLRKDKQILVIARGLPGSPHVANDTDGPNLIENLPILQFVTISRIRGIDARIWVCRRDPCTAPRQRSPMNHKDATELLASSPAYEPRHKELIQDALNDLLKSNIDPDVQDVIRDQMFA